MMLSIRATCRSTRGFSLVETMVTLAIMVVLTVIAVPGMVNLFRDARQSTQTDMLVSTLNNARLEAVRRGGNGVIICPLASAISCSATNDWSAGFAVGTCSDATCSGITTVLQRVETKSGTTVTSTANSVTFRGVIGSSAVATTTTISVCATGRKKQQATIEASGHVSKIITTTDC